MKLMKLPALVAGAMLTVGMLVVLAGCTSSLTALTSTTVNRHDVLVTIMAANTVQDAATAAMAGCLATHSRTGICTPAVVRKLHTALVAMRGPRDQLNAFAQAHGDQRLGVTGLYDAVVASKDALLAILVQYGAAAPA